MRHTTPRVANRGIAMGFIAAAGLVLFYIGVVAGASGSWDHFTSQARQDWYYLAFIVGGFGVQVALMSELRRRKRFNHAVVATSGVGAGASTIGMAACCAHHIADLAPFIGATGAAAFLTDYRVPFMIVGIGVNTVGIILAARRLRHAPTRHERSSDGTSTTVSATTEFEHRETEACAAV